MKRLYTLCLPLFFFVFSYVGLMSMAYSAETMNDVRIVIDISGSMKKSDPKNLRASAAELLVSLLPKNSKAGVWTFGRYVNMLVKYDDVDGRWVQGARNKINKINSVGLYTNIGSALEKAGFDAGKKKPGINRSIILLTDGVVDISKDKRQSQVERNRIIKDILPRFKRAGIKIHTVALSDRADHKLMERLAIETNGFTAVAHSADDLMKIFLQAFDKSVPAEEVPLEDNRFSIDKSIQEFTALVFRKPGARQTKLASPDGRLWSKNTATANVRWHSTGKYDLITVSKPAAGLWRLEADVDPSNRVTVVSDLKLEVNQLKNNYFPDEVPTVQARLMEDGKLLQEASFLNLMSVKLVVENAQGKRRSKKMKKPSGGVFGTTLKGLPPKGSYKVIVEVDGKTFSRKRQQTIAYKEPLKDPLPDMGNVVEEKLQPVEVAPPKAIEKEPAEPVIMAEVTEFFQNNQKKFLVKVIPDEFVDTYGSSVVAREKLPTGRSVIRSAPLQDEGYWKLVVDDVSAEGEYRIDFTILGKTKGGRSFKAKPESLRIVNPMTSEKMVVQLWGAKSDETMPPKDLPPKDMEEPFESAQSEQPEETDEFTEEPAVTEEEEQGADEEAGEELIPPPIDISQVMEAKPMDEASADEGAEAEAQAVEEEVIITEDSIEEGTETNFTLANILLVSGLVVGNILIIGLAVFAYRKLMGPDVASEALSEDEDEEIEETAEEEDLESEDEEEK